MTQAASDTDDYEHRLRAQQEQYKSGAELHTLPDIFSYWTNRYVLERDEFRLDNLSC